MDSSVAAALLQKEGHEVIGMTMCFGVASSDEKPGCCGMQAIEDARRICHRLGIRHYVVDLQKVFKEKVIGQFLQEYAAGRTPNPCIRCNQFVKFDALMKKALALDADYLATGHYARITKQAGIFRLKKGVDKFKDQSYFLYRFTQKQLRHTLFPVGIYTKAEVRSLAREFELPVADKRESQEICFLGDEGLKDFLRRRLTAGVSAGHIKDKYGRHLGRHQGIAFYTVGQREGLGIAAGYPVYISSINAASNLITIGPRKDCHAREFLVRQANFITGRPKKKVVLKVKIRYNHKESAAEVFAVDSCVKVIFGKPQFAITAGQSAVFYDRDTVVGGGIINRVIK